MPERASLDIPPVETHPLRVVIVFTDGSVFSYFEERDVTYGQREVVGTWYPPYPAMVAGIVTDFQSVPMATAMHDELGDIVAIAVKLRDGALVPCTAPDCDGLCKECGGSGYLEWRSE